MITKTLPTRTLAQAAALTLLVGAGAATHALAQPATAAPAPVAAGAAAAPTTPWADGEITRWDPRTLRITLRHGEIKNLEMPPMTMVFRVQDASVVGDLKPGDKVRFQAQEVKGALQAMQVEKAP